MGYTQVYAKCACILQYTKVIKFSEWYPSAYIHGITQAGLELFVTIPI